MLHIASYSMVSQTNIQLREIENKRQLELEKKKLKLKFEERRRADKEEREERLQREKLAYI